MRGRTLQRYAPSPVPPALGPDLLPWLAREFQRVAQVQDNANWDGIEGTPPELPPAPHDHIEADITDLDRMRWRGQWADGAYERNDVVRAERWLMVANKDTADPAAPASAGNAWQIDPEPVWGGSNTALIFGLRVTQFPCLVYGVRVRAKQSGNFDIWLQAVDGRMDIAAGLALTAGVWREFHVRPMIIDQAFDVVVSGGSYNEAIDYWDTHPGLQGFLTATYPPTPAEVTEDAYGVDVLIEWPTQSADWDVISWQA
jgi:hypothetical protein